MNALTKKNHLANVLIFCISSYPQQGRKNKHSYFKKSALFHLLVTALHERHPDLSLYCWSHHSRSHVVSVSFETLNKMSPGIERKVCGRETPFSRRKKNNLWEAIDHEINTNCDILILHSVSLNTYISIYRYMCEKKKIPDPSGGAIILQKLVFVS